jgi:hypothetical protein
MAFSFTSILHRPFARVAPVEDLEELYRRNACVKRGCLEPLVSRRPGLRGPDGEGGDESGPNRTPAVREREPEVSGRGRLPQRRALHARTQRRPPPRWCLRRSPARPFQGVANHLVGERRKLLLRYGNRAPTSPHERHGGGGGLDLDKAVPLPDVDPTSTVKSESVSALGMTTRPAASMADLMPLIYPHSPRWNRRSFGRLVELTGRETGRPS